MDSLKEIYQKKIKILSETVWDGRAKSDEVDNWLNNFSQSDEVSQDEQIHALYLLSNYMYFSSEEIKEMLKAIYRDLFKYPIIKLIREENNHTLDRGLINDKFDEELKLSRFLGVGNPSESGSHLLYYFRQENNIPKKYFINLNEIYHYVDGSLQLKNPEIKRYVFIDDFCGGGTQVETYLKEEISKIKSISSDIELDYFVLFAGEDGLEYAKNNVNFDKCDAVFKLDKSYRCFGRDSRYEPDEGSKLCWSFAKNMTQNYGNSLYQNHPLGHNNCQFLLGFFHNTPNNTLPIIWKNSESWQPIFRRYDKLYG